jgi:hypothetical protein
MRDENFENYIRIRDYGKSMCMEQYSELPRNSNLAPEFQKLNDELFEFFNSLNEVQTESLNRIILNILDSSSFNFLRGIEEILEKIIVLV